MEPETFHDEWRPYWMPNAQASSCIKCETPFSMFLRKHHCRKCGEIFCDNCWGKEIYVNAYHKFAKVCDTCYILAEKK